MPRIFISYRAADGADKAAALARDLGRVFGDDQVFIDKDDLTGGVHWADEVSRALQSRPVLLLLVTPELLAVNRASGRRVLDDPDTPVRREITAALAAGAVVVPVLCDGVDTLPPGLPPPLDSLTERTWRRLRTHDWRTDLRRLVQDLHTLGVAPHGPRGARQAVLLGLAALAAAGAGLAWWRRGPAQDQAHHLTGRWSAHFGDETAVMHLLHEGQTLRLESEPVDIRARADWAEYRQFWQGRFGSALDAVRYRGQGSVRTPAGSPLAIDIGFRVLSVPGDQDIDGGNLSAALQPDGQLLGQRWLNGAQAEVPARLQPLR